MNPTDRPLRCFLQAGVFFSTASLGGGQETTALSCIPFFTHLGMVFVPLGYRDKALANLDEVHGGSPYGKKTDEERKCKEHSEQIL